MRKKLFLGIPVVVILALAIGFPWYKLQAKNADLVAQQERITVAQSFVNTYGASAKINNIVNPEDIKIYGYLWNDSEYNYVSLWVNGAWVDIAKVQIQKLSSTPTP